MSYWYNDTMAGAFTGRLTGENEQMLESNAGRRTLNILLKVAVGTLVLLAIIACTSSDEGSASSPTPPTGMFSTLPTTEPPIEGDQPPTVELNTPQPTFTPNPTYTPVPMPTPNPTGTPVNRCLLPTRRARPCRCLLPTRRARPCRCLLPTRRALPCRCPLLNPHGHVPPVRCPLPTRRPLLTLATSICYGVHRYAVIRAVWEGPKAVRCVLKQGADVNAKDSRGYSALWWAILQEKPEIVGILLDAGAKTGTSQ